jgi:hypothetical protein
MMTTTPVNNTLSIASELGGYPLDPPGATTGPFVTGGSTYDLTKEDTYFTAKSDQQNSNLTRDKRLVMKRLGLSKRQFNEAIHDIKGQVEGNPNMMFDPNLSIEFNGK